MLEDQLNQAALACAEVSMDSTARQALKEPDRLLSEKFFEFVSGHIVLVTRIVPEKRGLHEEQDGSNLLTR